MDLRYQPQHSYQPLHKEILPYLEQLHDELKIPPIYVSHSMDEIVQLADYLVLLDHGQAIAQCSLEQTLATLERPGAFAEEPGVILETKVSAHDDGDADSILPEAIYTSAAASQALGRRLRCKVLTLEHNQSILLLNLLPAKVTALVDSENPA